MPSLDRQFESSSSEGIASPNLAKEVLLNGKRLRVAVYGTVWQRKALYLLLALWVWHPVPSAFAGNSPQSARSAQIARGFRFLPSSFESNVGHRDLWALEAILNPSATASQKAA